MKDKSQCLRTYNLILMRNGLIIHNLGRQFVTVYVIQRGLMIVFSADRLKVQKETKLYISLMLEDEKLSKH